MARIAVIIYGPPGSGKGTQANLIADRLDLIHLDTGRFLENLIHDPLKQKSKIIKKERNLFDSGKLMTPSFVFREITRRVQLITKTGHGVVLSGSPRTMYEAKGLLPVLEKLYGKKNICVFTLQVGENISIKRNSNRIVCSVCKAPLLSAFYPSKNPKFCPLCAGPFYRRSLDNKATIKVRLEEYRNRTEPIFKYLQKRGYKVNRINGEPPPHLVFKKIYGHFKNFRRD